MRAVPGLLLVFAVACASAPPPKTEYLLRYDAPPSAEVLPSRSRVGLRRVLVAAYLNQPGLAVETTENEVRPARSHLWAEPLDVGLTLFLRAAIADALGEEVGMVTRSVPQWERSVDVFVEQFHGTMSGNAVLVASFQITSGAASAPTEYRFARSIPLESEGYAALVRAEKQLAEQLAAAIVAALTSTR
ncbi:MAG: PqiC family protein [Myxococcota bacterium]|nr:hypothetical protein [Deltaproteobacteria bacterium]MCP4242216.1 membrane integrity-associated transporter subunit PqiC [bacterium]MDP6242759.1 PqiC family protein [Myxococcota bacterium]MDP7074380.1 PqiC family protein [Myxococcota bacterium]MDP7300534.1 PqiC family protein [Myxococcota bacterium]